MMRKEVERLALEYMSMVIKTSGLADSLFRSVLEINFDGETKPLLLVGHAHPKIEDGHIIAIVNPDISLISQINPGCAYNRMHLKEMVSKKCDLMLDLFIEVYKTKKIQHSNHYKQRKSSKPKFKINEIKLQGY